MVTTLEGNIYFINQDIKSFWGLCSFVLKYAPRENLMKGIKLLGLGFLSIIIISFSQGRYDAVFIVMYFVLGIVSTFFLRWFIYYQIYRKKYVSFRGHGFSYKSKQIKFHQIAKIKIHTNSNMTLVLNEFPYGYMFIGYGQEFYGELIRSVREVKPTIEVIDN